MTCIVGLVDNGSVYIAGDSAGVDKYSIVPRVDTKVFQNGPFIMGYTTSFRMGQVLRFKFVPPEQPKDCEDDYKFMVVNFIDAVKKCFTDNECEKGNFLVGYRGQLYDIEEDYQVGVSYHAFESVGCGRDLAMGAMFATAGKKPVERLKIAIGAAVMFSGGVCEPINIIRLKPVKKAGKILYEFEKVDCSGN